ncbi:hypothetical protein [Microbacterium azadirachtae]|nr:hypothetical protein [Microbacterium azadirachtae]SDL34398.1 hypothetical protein SAMN04488593_0770 [Microbacterium azadirachtae]
MKVLRGILIAIVVVGVPSSFLLLTSRNNPNVIRFLPEDWQTFIVQHDWIGFLVFGIEVAALLGSLALGALIKKRENAA